MARWALLAVAAVAAPHPGARAQGDQEWGVDGGADRRDEIIRRYRSILDRNPAPGAILDRLVQEVGGGPTLDALIEEYGALAAADTAHVAYALMHGHLLMRADRLPEARAAYERAVAAQGDGVLPHRSLGDVLRRLDDRAGATAAYERALELAVDADTRRALLHGLADLAFEARTWDVAAGYVERLVAVDPADATVRMELADLYMRYERYPEALAQYDALVSQAGTDTRQRALALVDAGGVLALMGDVEGAIDRYVRARGLVEDGYWLTREIDQRIVAAYRQVGRLGDLVARYEREWRTPSAAQWARLGALYDEVGREEDAVNAFRRAIRAGGATQDVRLALIAALERRGDLDGVLVELEALARQSPDDASYRFRVVDVLRRVGRRDDAVAELDAIAVRFASVPHVLSDVADRYQRFGDAEKSLRTLERLVRIEPSEPNNHVALGEAHFQDGRRSEAERVWRGVLTIVRPEADAHALLGDVFLNHGLAEEAVLELERSLELDPSDDEVHRALARAFEESGRLSDALRVWEQLSTEADQHHLRGDARSAIVRLLDRLGRLPEEVPRFERDFRGPPRDVEAGYLLAEALGVLERSADVEATWLAVLEVDASDVIALDALADIYTDSGRIAEAIGALDRVAAAHPARSRDVYHRLAQLSLRVFDDEGAVRFARLAVDLNPDSAQAHERLGDVLRQMQRLDEAADAYRQALLIDARAFTAAFSLAEVLLALDAPREADTWYRTILAEAADDVMVLRAGRRSIQIGHALDGLDELGTLLERRLSVPDPPEALLRLLVELYEHRTAPLAQRARLGSSSERASARSELEQLSRRALQPLLDGLASDDVGLRRTALSVLRAQRNRGASGAILRLLDEPDGDLRIDAALALVELADASAVSSLERAAMTRAAPVDALAACALTLLDTPEAGAALARLASAAGSAEAQTMALSGLGSFVADPAVAAAVLDGLADSSPEFQRAAIIAAGAGRLSDALDQVALRLQHGTRETAVAAAWALAHYPASEAVVAALAEAFTSGDDVVAAAAGEALARLTADGRASDPRAPGLELGLYDAESRSVRPDVYLGARVRWAAGDASPPREVSALAPFGAVMTRIIGDTLGGRTLARRRLIATLATGAVPGALGLGPMTGTSAGAAAAQNGRLARDWVLPSADALAVVATDGDPELRASALVVLAALSDARVAPLSARASTDPQVAVRAAAQRALALSGQSAPAVVDSGLTDTHWAVRAEAVRALAALRGPEASERLRALAADPAATVRMAAVEGLFVADTAAAVEVCLALWETAPPTVRIQLAEIAIRLGSSPEPIRERAARDPDPRVRALVPAR